MISKRQLRNLMATYWQPSLLFGIMVLAAAALLLFRLRILTGGYSLDELASFHQGDGFRHILDNPINAPYFLLVRCLLFLHQHSLIFLRIIATLFGLLTLTSFYWLVRHWHGERSATLGTIIFACSAWFLHTARLGTPDVLLFLLLTLAACITWLQRTDNRFALLLGVLLIAALLYVPGMIWFLIAAAIWQAKTIMRLLKRHSALVPIGVACMIALITPLGWALYKSPHLIKVLVGLPAVGWPGLFDSLRRLADIPLQLFIRGPLSPQDWLGRLPVLDAFCIAMFVLGGYLYTRHRHLARAKIVAVALLIGTLLIALGGAVNLSILVPFVYVVIAAGIGFMLDHWYKVFPRNAIAQGVGLGLIIAAIAASCWFGLRHYFVAWPHAPATEQVFVVKR